VLDHSCGFDFVYLATFTIQRSCIARRLSALKVFFLPNLTIPYLTTILALYSLFYVHFIESTSRFAPDLLTIPGHSKRNPSMRSLNSQPFTRAAYEMLGK